MVLVYSSPEIEVKVESQHEIETTLQQLREEMLMELEQIKTVDWGVKAEMKATPREGKR